MRLAACFLTLFGVLVPTTVAAQESLDPERDAMYARYMSIPSLIEGGVICPSAIQLTAHAAPPRGPTSGQIT
ncbi:MAG: hypothetical protein OXI83_11860, partial [Gemmatimonadota bacterium]|nr:hypothetical protein [Gemmatimonadota bacterium]